MLNEHNLQIARYIVSYAVLSLLAYSGLRAVLSWGRDSAKNLEDYGNFFGKTSYIYTVIKSNMRPGSNHIGQRIAGFILSTISIIIILLLIFGKIHIEKNNFPF